MFFARLKRFFVIAVALAVAGPLVAQKSTGRSRPATGSAGIYKGYIVIDAATGNVLLEDNPNVVAPPASMTKIMTFLVVDDAIKAGTLSLDTPVRITEEDWRMGGTQVHLDPRETFTVEELLYALMIQSANDAATALARAAAGSREIFVERMNARARALGMNNTRFVTPHGLPPSSRNEADGDLTTPADFARLSREAVLKTDILRYSSVKRRTFGAAQRLEPTVMDNHNKLLGRVDGVDGLKTGYTRAAGYCLAATAERNGRRIISVIMGSFGPKGEIDMGRSRDLKTIELLERGFASLPSSPIATPAAAAAQSPIRAATPATTEGAPVRTNLSAPRRPESPVSPVSPVSPPNQSPQPEEQPEELDEGPSVKFVPVRPGKK